MIDILAANTLSKTIAERITYLRYSDTCGEWTREYVIQYIGALIEDLYRMCDLPGGWNDPNDPAAEMKLRFARLDFHELTRPGNPYPIPRDDPRPRTETGKLAHIVTESPALREYPIIGTVEWSPDSENWKRFCLGKRPGRFWLTNGTNVTVVPPLATPPQGCADWIRPEAFWERVPAQDETKWIPFKERVDKFMQSMI